MSRLLEKYKLLQQENDVMQHQSCLDLVSYMKDIVNNQYEMNEPINNKYFRSKKRYNTQCPEFAAFINETNVSENVLVRVTDRDVNNINTYICFESEKVLYRLSHKY